MIVYGKQVVTYILEKHENILKKIYLSKEIDKKLFSKILQKNIPFQKVDDKKAQGMSRGGSHQGFIAEIEDFEPQKITDFRSLNKVVILTGITDMGNIGSIIRTSYSLGIDALFVTGLKQVNWQGAIKASSGAIFEIPVDIVTNVFDLHNDLKTSGFITLGATLNGGSIPKECLDKKVALFLGSESEGLPARLEKRLDHKVTIKMRNDFDSLNVSNAAAILIDRITNEGI